MPYFQPPVAYDQPPYTAETSRGVLLYARRRPPQPRGRSVVKVAGVYTIVDGPSMELQATASVTYLGGHVYYISDAESEALQAAGFTTIPDFGFTVFPLADLYPSETLFPGFDYPVNP